MAEIERVKGRPEPPEVQARREWLERQALASPGALEAAARTIVGLVTGLLSVLFGVLAVAGDPLPSYFWLPWVRPLGIGVVVALLAALACALMVLLPRRIDVSRHRVDEQAAAFERLLRRKSCWLTAAAIAFGAALGALGAILIVALLRVV